MGCKHQKRKEKKLNELQIKNQTIDSKEVAEMVEKNHADLLRDIRNYVEYLGKSKIALADFFVESTYKDVQGKERPCYQVTKKGCEFIAHKLTGHKGAVFTAKYINRFHEMENNLIKLDSYMIIDPIERAKAWITEQEERQQLLIENKQQQQIIGELKPKADYMDTILKNPGLVTITQIAKDYGMSGKEMNDLLHSYGIQYKQSNQWLLYREFHDKGYTHSQTINITRSDGRPDVKMNTKWTQKGRMFIYSLLKENNILPVIEQKKVV